MLIFIHSLCFKFDQSNKLVIVLKQTYLLGVNQLHIKTTFWTYPADFRKIAAVDSNKHDWDWKKKILKKRKNFVQKHFLSPIYFDGIS